MCSPWDTACMANEVAIAVSNTMFGQISMLITTAEEWLIDVSASWWVIVPSISLYPDAHNTNPDAAPIDAVANLHALIMPITMVVAVGGMLWNGLLMVLSRKPAPLVNVMRGLWNTALWAAVGIFGTQLLLAGSDALSNYVIITALRSVGNPSFAKRLSVMLVPVTGQGGLPVGMVILVGGIATVCAFVQAILMLFRDGSVLILAACTPLAASGSFANATNGWKNKLLSWQLALIFYKPMAAMVYAVSIWLTGENSSIDPRVLLFGVAMMIVALIALPVLLKFFNWTVGSLQNGGGGLGMFATAGAAGAHAAASLRGGASGVNEHARYISDTFGGASSGGGPSGGGSPPPSGAPSPSSPPPAPSGGAPGGVPKFQGSPGGGSPGGGAPGGMPMPGPTPRGGGSGGQEGREGSQAVMTAVNTGTSVVEGVAPATGPAAPFVQAGAQVVRTGAQMANSAANSTADAASDATKGG
jgi:hypothetical protein